MLFFSLEPHIAFVMSHALLLTNTFPPFPLLLKSAQEIIIRPNAALQTENGTSIPSQAA